MTNGNVAGPDSVELVVARDRHRNTLLGAAVLALLAVGCAKASTGGGSSGGIAHSRDPKGLVVKIETGGGFIGPQAHYGEFPTFALYGDGSLIVPGPQIEIYPAPALPNLQVTRITEDGVQAILRAARQAGLLGPDRRYDFPTIADAPTTTFRVVAEGSRHVTSVYALDEGAGAPAPDMPADEVEARKARGEFRNRLGDLTSWLPPGSVSEGGAYRFDDLRIFVLPPVAPDPQLDQKAMRWPLSQPLATFGRPVQTGPEARCGSVSGDDLSALLPHVEKANELTPWESGGATFSLVLRPLLPDESGCQGL